MFFNNHLAPENENTETLGNALFDNGNFEEWGGLYTNNVVSIFLVTVAFLGLLQKASYTRGVWSASVVNISSMSGSGKFYYTWRIPQRDDKTIPFQRGGRRYSEVDMRGAALFLASPASYYITGQVLNTDGGVLAVRPATGA
ncbi:Splicing factor [Ceratobasidium sp. 428]|nr:Splicing factor [Ceratobasidium sp. 428]